ncbi:queuosine-tRNA galactosyltransferase isoform X1 [Gorilla gorilla gorilla]|uniref:queuosine-tRNA galactosyltransferase isoform X1 n=1 Tax=Gorilla gorilla gorilla TaxID=9595 RepID=UPI003009C4CE
MSGAGVGGASEERQAMQAHVSIILPVHNAEPWLDECLRSVLQQDFEGTMELSVFNDASKDKSGAIIEKWRVKLEDSGVHVIIGGHDSPSPRGVGYAKNQAVAQSSGSYLCFLDSDDVMMPQRVRLQHEAAIQHPSSIIGCRVRRDPPNSTERYTRWINQLTPEQLLTQVFTSNGPTVIMPTWFCSRAWFSHVGPFNEGGQVRAEGGNQVPLPGSGPCPLCVGSAHWPPSALPCLRGSGDLGNPCLRVLPVPPPGTCQHLSCFAESRGFLHEGCGCPGHLHLTYTGSRLLHPGLKAVSGKAQDTEAFGRAVSGTTEGEGEPILPARVHLQASVSPSSPWGCTCRRPCPRPPVGVHLQASVSPSSPWGCTCRRPCPHPPRGCAPVGVRVPVLPVGVHLQASVSLSPRGGAPAGIRVPVPPWGCTCKCPCPCPPHGGAPAGVRVPVPPWGCTCKCPCPCPPHGGAPAGVRVPVPPWGCTCRRPCPRPPVGVHLQVSVSLSSPWGCTCRRPCPRPPVGVHLQASVSPSPHGGAPAGVRVPIPPWRCTCRRPCPCPPHGGAPAGVHVPVLPWGCTCRRPCPCPPHGGAPAGVHVPVLPWGCTCRRPCPCPPHGGAPAGVCVPIPPWVCTCRHPCPRPPVGVHLQASVSLSSPWGCTYRRPCPRPPVGVHLQASVSPSPHGGAPAGVRVLVLPVGGAAAGVRVLVLPVGGAPAGVRVPIPPVGVHL